MVPCDELPSHHHVKSIPNHFGSSELVEITHWPLNYIAYFYLFTYWFYYFVLISFPLLYYKLLEGRKYFLYHWLYPIASSLLCFILKAHLNIWQFVRGLYFTLPSALHNYFSVDIKYRNVMTEKVRFVCTQSTLSDRFKHAD